MHETAVESHGLGTSASAVQPALTRQCASGERRAASSELPIGRSQVDPAILLSLGQLPLQVGVPKGAPGGLAERFVSPSRGSRNLTWIKGAGTLIAHISGLALLVRAGQPSGVKPSEKYDVRAETLRAAQRAATAKEFALQAQSRRDRMRQAVDAAAESLARRMV